MPHGSESSKVNRAYRDRKFASSGDKSSARAYRLLRSSWPLLALIPLAALTNLILIVAFEDPWPPSEFAATVVFGMLVTVAAIIIGRRQGELQQALADANLVSTASSIWSSLESLKNDFDAGVVQSVLTKSRSGLPLLKFSKPSAGREYLDVVLNACQLVDADFNMTLRAHSSWREDDWAQIAACTAALRDDLKAQRRFQGPEELAITGQLDLLLLRMTEHSEGHGVIRFETFQSAFFRGDVQERIRAMLDWETVEKGFESGDVRLAMVRQWSVDWLREHDAYTVWHVTPDGEFCDFHEEAARPIPVHHIGELFESLPADTRATINMIGRTFNFRTTRRGLHIAEIVTLQQDDKSLLILDGNHRMSAIVRGPDGHRGPLGVQVVEYRITSGLGVPLVPEQMANPEKSEFREVLVGVLAEDRAATPRDVWTAWRGKVGEA